MPESMRVRIITRDISGFPHRDLENVPLQTDLMVWWGEKPLLPGYVTVFELGQQRLDFGGGLDPTSRSEDTYDTSHDASASLPGGSRRGRSTRRPAARKKTTRKKAKAQRGAGRSRGRGAAAR